MLAAAQCARSRPEQPWDNVASSGACGRWWGAIHRALRQAGVPTSRRWTQHCRDQRATLRRTSAPPTWHRLARHTADRQPGARRLQGTHAAPTLSRSLERRPGLPSDDNQRQGRHRTGQPAAVLAARRPPDCVFSHKLDNGPFRRYNAPVKWATSAHLFDEPDLFDCRHPIARSHDPPAWIVKIGGSSAVGSRPMVVAERVPAQ
jgi:hypothetical protein